MEAWKTGAKPVRIERCLSLLMAAACGLWPWPARAAQDAVVAATEAFFRDRPSDNGSVLERVPYGSLIRVSDRSKDGWYQARLPGSGGVGWVRASEISPAALKGNLRGAGISATEATSSISGRFHFIFAGFFDSHYFMPPSFEGVTGAGPSGRLALGYSAALGYRLRTDWTLRARFDSLSLENEGLALSSNAASLLLEYAIIHSKPWKVEFGLGPSLSLGATVSATTDADIVSASVPSSPGGIARFHVHWYFISRMSLGIEAGYRYYLDKVVDLGGAEATAGLSAPFAGVGLQLEL